MDRQAGRRAAGHDVVDELARALAPGEIERVRAGFLAVDVERGEAGGGSGGEAPGPSPHITSLVAPIPQAATCGVLEIRNKWLISNTSLVAYMLHACPL